MANNFFKIKNGVNLPTLSADPTVTPPTNSATGDMAFYGGKLYKYNGSAWVVSPGSGTTGLIINADVDAAAAIDGTKINPDFGAQLVKTTSKLEVRSNTAAEAVLINQIGTGNALVVEDSANPDTTATVIDASGNVGIGVASGATLTEKLKVVGDVKVDSTGAITIPVGADGGRPGTPAQGMIRYNTTQSAFEGYDGTTWSSIGGATTIDRITQATHGFAVGEVLYLNGSTYTRARADVAATAEVVGMVSRVIDANTFELTICGEVVGLAAARFDELALPSTGAVVFLSPTNAGNMTITAPTVVGQISLPIGVASASGSIYVRPSRGVTVGGANVRTQINLTNNATTTVQNASAYDAGELAGWVYIDATADTRFYIQAQFAKNGANSDFNLAYQTTGDTPPVGFSMTITAAGLIQVTLPSIAGFSSAIINFALNAPAVGATLPLQIASTNVSFTDIQASTASGITFKEDGGTAVGSVSDAGVWSFGPSITNNYTGRSHVISGGFTAGNVTSTNASGRLYITSNCNVFDHAATSRTNTVTAGTGISLDNGTANGNSAFAVYTNLTGDALTADASTVGYVTYDGAWTLGPSGFTGSHAIRGGFDIQGNVTNIITYRPTATTTDYLVQLRSDVGGLVSTKWRVEADGDTISATGSYTSDERAKKNFAPIQYGLSEVMRLQPKSFNWWHEEDTEVKSFCVSTAQEVQAIMPEMVRDDGLDGPNGEKMKAIYDKELVPVLVKAIQEQQEQIEALKAEIQLLKNK